MTARALRRSLGVLNLTAFGVGNTVGAGIFVLTGTVAALNAGPAVTLCFILASVACFFAGLCYAEYASMVPVAGSAYSYAYATFGELVAWIIGWCIMFEYLFSASLVAISWSGYVTSALGDLGLHIPAVLANAPLRADATDHIIMTGAWINLPAVLVTLACTALLIAGTQKSAMVNSVIVVAKVLAITGAGRGLPAAHRHAPLAPLRAAQRRQDGPFRLVRCVARCRYRVFRLHRL